LTDRNGDAIRHVVIAHVVAIQSQVILSLLLPLTPIEVQGITSRLIIEGDIGGSSDRSRRLAAIRRRIEIQKVLPSPAKYPPLSLRRLADVAIYIERSGMK
jgi:hypothetical protein